MTRLVSPIFTFILVVLVSTTSTHVSAFTTIKAKNTVRRRATSPYFVKSSSDDSEENVVIIGGGWGGLSAAYALYKHNVNLENKNDGKKKYSVTLVEASNRVGGLVRDGFTSTKGLYKAEAGQHGFWDNYHNIFKLLEELPNINVDDVLTGYAEQGQYSPNGLEAVWPVYRRMKPSLPTGLAQGRSHVDICHFRILFLPLALNEL